MDKYFIFVDQNFTSEVIVVIIIALISFIGSFFCIKLFKFKISSAIFFVPLLIGKFIIGTVIMRNDVTIFKKTEINSIIVEQVDWRPNGYRNKLNNGLTFYTTLEVVKGDSIVKLNNDSFYRIFRIDYNGNYKFVKKYKYSQSW
jgi:hypothetical protein